nr:MurT ligase domain-containing protein [Eubacterium sp.]
TYSQLGEFYCENCGYKREKPDFSVEAIMETGADFSSVFVNLNGHNSIFKINLGGVYNIYNSIGSAAVLSVLGIEIKILESSLKSFSGAFGRMENFGSTKMLLVKNPAGFTQTMNYIKPLKINNLVFVLNDNAADGCDVSWIWDADIEIGENIKNIYAFGVRSGDMALRLKYEGYEPKVITSYEEFYTVTDEENTVIIPTYTAMMALRPYLAQKYKKDEFWK